MDIGEGSRVERAWSVLSGGEKFRSKAGWGSIGVDREVPDVGLETGRFQVPRRFHFWGNLRWAGVAGAESRVPGLALCVGGTLLSMTVCVDGTGVPDRRSRWFWGSC